MVLLVLLAAQLRYIVDSNYVGIFVVSLSYIWRGGPLSQNSPSTVLTAYNNIRAIVFLYVTNIKATWIRKWTFLLCCLTSVGSGLLAYLFGFGGLFVHCISGASIFSVSQGAVLNHLSCLGQSDQG